MTEKYNVKPERAQALKDLEKLLGKFIPSVEEIEFNTFGVKVEGKNVIGLSLYDQGLSTLPESIGELSSLQTLNLRDNYLSTLPESIGNLKSLQELKLSSNKLTTLPESIGNLKSLRTLDLGHNKLTTLPESIGNLSSLIELYLLYNRLSTLPESITKLKSLQILYISNNKLPTLPESIGDLASLTELNLDSNELTTLPESMGNLKSLQLLILGDKLGGNKLSTLPESIGDLASLTELNLDSNELTTLPESIGNLTLLQELRLQNNKLTTFPESIKNLKSLKEISLRKNKWKGEWEDMETINDIPNIFELCRKLHGIVIFISHAMADQKQYSVKELKKYLENEVIIKEAGAKTNIIHEVYLCEVSFIADIEKFMEENVPKSHLLIFLGTKNSLASEACRKELFLARKFGVKILPIKGMNIKWNNLSKIDLREHGQSFIDLSKLEGFEFVNFNDICVNLRKYIEKHESELKKSKKGVEIVEITKKTLAGVINSKEFRDVLKDNFEDFKGIFQELSKNQITTFNYLLKLGQILNKRTEN